MTAVSSSVDLRNDVRIGVRSRVNPTTVLLAGTLIAVWTVSLSRSLFDPLGPDQTVFHYITERIIAGQCMYADLWSSNTPGIIPIHWLSIKLFGSSYISLRVIDACWQLATVAALVTLARRDQRRWPAAYLAGIMYVLAYYGYGYMETAQREGFAVLPMLLAVHAVAASNAGQARDSRAGSRGYQVAALNFFAGVMGFYVFAIKPPLGMCFGVLWLQALVDAWRRRRTGFRAALPIVGLSLGFILSTILGAFLVIRLGWWAGYQSTIAEFGFPRSLVLGPWMLRTYFPYLLAALAVIGVVVGFGLKTSPFNRGRPVPKVLLIVQWSGYLAVGMVVFGLLLLMCLCSFLGRVLILIAGLVIPVVGALLIRPWKGRSRIWRSMLLLLCASFGAILLQGRWSPYRFAPVLACAAYLGAGEITERFQGFRRQSRGVRVWAVVCLAAVVYMGVGHWWQKMSEYTRAPYVLAGSTLDEHYMLITKKTKGVPFETLLSVSQRVRELTEETDPIACLLDEPRLYYCCRRPPVHRMIFPNHIYTAMYPDFIRTICERKPKVVLARIPGSFRRIKDMAQVRSAVFDDIESFYGPSGRRIGEYYNITEVINDVCILQPIKTSTGTELIPAE